MWESILFPFTHYRSIVPLGDVVVKMTITHFFLKRMHVFCVVGAIIPFRYSAGVSISRVSYVYIRSMADNSQQITLWLPCSPTNMEVQPSLGNYFLSVVSYKRLDELFIFFLFILWEWHQFPANLHSFDNSVFKRDIEDYPHGYGRASLNLAYYVIIVGQWFRFCEGLFNTSLYGLRGLSQFFPPHYTIFKKIEEVMAFYFLRWVLRGCFWWCPHTKLPKIGGTFPHFLFYIDDERFVTLRGQAIKLLNVDGSLPLYVLESN